MFGYSQSKAPQKDSESVKRALDANEQVILLDVRTPGEHSRGRIPNSINIPLDKLTLTVSQKIPDTTKTLYVYCLSGSRSVIAVDQLLKMGYTNVFEIKSGLLSWRNQGFPTSQ